MEGKIQAIGLQFIENAIKLEPDRKATENLIIKIISSKNLININKAKEYIEQNILCSLKIVQSDGAIIESLCNCCFIFRTFGRLVIVFRNQPEEYYLVLYLWFKITACTNNVTSNKIMKPEKYTEV